MHKVSAEWVISLYLSPELSKRLSLKLWQSLILVLRNQQLLACYSERFKQMRVFDDIPAKIKRHFLNADVLAANHRKQVEFEAEELKQSLVGKQQFLIFLKGAGYTLSKAKVGENRIYNDIDVLADKQSISAIERRLSLLGWLSEDLTEHDDKYYRKWAHEIPPLRHGRRGTIIDIHHNIVPIISGRQLDADLFAAQSVTTTEGFQVLSFPAMTLHSLIHLFFNEDVKKGYRDLIDIHTLMTSNNNQEFWLTLVKLAKETGFALELFLACRYTQKLLETKIPDDVVREISQFKPWNMSLLDFMYSNTLKPNHPICRGSSFELAEFLVLIRGHFQKMPLHILIFHLFTKSWISIIQMIFGKHVFTKQLDQP